MTLRYCPDCDKWYDTAEYDVDSSGETVCPVDGHAAVSGSIQPSRYSRPSVSVHKEWADAALAAAVRQDLVSPGRRVTDTYGNRFVAPSRSDARDSA